MTWVALIFEGCEVGSENLDGEGALQAGFGLVHGVLGGLGVVEDDAGEGCELLLNGFDQLRLGAEVAGPGLVVIWLQADIELVVEEAGGVGAVIGAAQFIGHGGDLREAEQDIADLRGELGGFLERNGVGGGGAHPERAFIQVGHELAADEGDEQERTAEDGEDHRHRDQAIAEAPAEHAAVCVADPLIEHAARGSCTCLRRK